MVIRSEAEKALATLQGRKDSKVGGTLQMINLGGIESESGENVTKVPEVK